MTLKERILAEETKLGHILKTWITGILLVLSILGGANEYLSMIPSDFIPEWLKITVCCSGTGMPTWMPAQNAKNLDAKIRMANVFLEKF